MIAYCGLSCSECPAFIATRSDDDSLRVKCAAKWRATYKSEVKPENINCDGCKSDGIKFIMCNSCGVRKCASQKGLDNCAVCEDYACTTLQQMWSIDPYFKTAIEALREKAGL
jgi:hypothetical protein